MPNSADPAVRRRCRLLLRSSAAIWLAAIFAVSCSKRGISVASNADAPQSGSTELRLTPQAPVSEGLTDQTDTALPPMDPIIARIREEGIDRSQVMQTLDYLCNVIGPRLTASQRLRDANEWTRQRLESWGMSNAHLDEWGPFGREWNVRRFSLQVIEPVPFNPIGYPRAWSPGLDAPTTAEVVFLDATREEDLEAFKGKLAGKFVLIGQPRTVEARFLPLATRQDDQRLGRLAQAEPGQEARDAAPVVENAAERMARFRASSGRNEALMNRVATSAPASQATSQPATRPATRGSTDPFTSRLLRFAAEEGAALTLFPSTIGDGGTFFVTSAAIPPRAPGTTEPSTQPRVYSVDAPPIPPQVTLAVEDYNRLARASRLGQTITMAAQVEVEFSDDNGPVFNTIAEIPGTDLAHEIVMVGAHIDSWHSSTGATDNGVGTACAMEAIRIIRALDLQPRRTIRVGLWSGEEQGLLGSEAYVKQHFGYVEEPPEPTTRPERRRAATRNADAAATQNADPATAPEGAGAAAIRPARRGRDRSATIVKLPDYENLSVYFNLDNGTGRIRGIYTQENRAAAPIFEAWLRPFHDLGAETVTLANTGGTDHLSFDRIGLPGFQFIQDPIEYSTRTHHSNMDVYDRIQAEDMKQASTIMAAFLWNAASMDERFPRKPAGDAR